MGWNSGVDLDHYDILIYPFIYRKVVPGRSWIKRKQPVDQHVTDHFRKNSYFSEILETTWITMQKSPLSVHGLSPEKPLAEILSLKKLTSTFKF